MPVPIESLPSVPLGLIEAAAKSTLVPFVGAGISQLAGCPRWADFADCALDSLTKQGKLSAAQRSQLGGLSPRVKLSVAKLAARRAGVQIDYRSILQKPRWSDDAEGRRVYGHLGELGNRFVTTNYDEWLDIVVPPPERALGTGRESGRTKAETKRVKLHSPEEMTAANFAPNTVVHLHGALDEPANMVLSTRDYIKRYANDGSTGDQENPVLRFLEYLFSQKTILFLGYGLEELEILEYVIQKAKHNSGSSERITSHYLLQGFFSFEEALCDSLHEYFLHECGIELIPFRRDENNWGQVIDVLAHFASALPSSRAEVAQDLAEMEALING